MVRFRLMTLLIVLLLSTAGESRATDDGELKSVLEKVVKAAGGNNVANAKAWT